jgi:hypothetical protein
MPERADAQSDRVHDASWAAITVELAHTVLDVLRGDEAAATDRLEVVLPETGPFEGFAHHAFGHVGALLYTLGPRSRPFFDKETTGVEFQAATNVGRALVALREHGSATLASLSVNPRRMLRNVADRHGDPVLSIAREELDRTASRPALTTYVQVLGPTLVSVGSVPGADTSPIRRKMVRELLLLLVHRRRIRRVEIAALMLPDKDETAARNNLRATLNHLRTLLELGDDHAGDRRPADTLAHALGAIEL